MPGTQCFRGVVSFKVQFHGSSIRIPHSAGEKVETQRLSDSPKFTQSQWKRNSNARSL